MTNQWGGLYRVRYGKLSYRVFPADFIITPPLFKRKEEQESYYSRMLASVEREGFRNPIVYLDRADCTTGCSMVTYGGTRAWAAIELKMDVPAFVVDYPEWNSLYDDWEDITRVRQALVKFQDLPNQLEFRPDSFDFWGCSQTHCDDENRALLDNLSWKSTDRHEQVEAKRQKRVAFYSVHHDPNIVDPYEDNHLSCNWRAP
jgi:hypothetical protein